MPGAHLTARELADELGRGVDWLHDHWRRLVKVRGMPAPLHDLPPLVWNRAHVVTWLDRDLSPEAQMRAAAWRAAHHAAGITTVSGRSDLEVALASATLDKALGVRL